MLSPDQQKTATNILKKFNETKQLSREDALTLQKLGVAKGRIGESINDTLAQGLDAEFVKQFKKAGGEDDLERAQQHLTESTEDFAKAQKDATAALKEYLEANAQFAKAADIAADARLKVETTKSDMEHYSNPTDLRPGETRHAAIGATEIMKAELQKAHAEFARALKELVATTVKQLDKQAADLREAKQMMNNAQH